MTMTVVVVEVVRVNPDIDCSRALSSDDDNGPQPRNWSSTYKGKGVEKKRYSPSTSSRSNVTSASPPSETSSNADHVIVRQLPQHLSCRSFKTSLNAMGYRIAPNGLALSLIVVHLSQQEYREIPGHNLRRGDVVQHHEQAVRVRVQLPELPRSHRRVHFRVDDRVAVDIYNDKVSLPRAPRHGSEGDDEEFLVKGNVALEATLSWSVICFVCQHGSTRAIVRRSARVICVTANTVETVVSRFLLSRSAQDRPYDQ